MASRGGTSGHRFLLSDNPFDVLRDDEVAPIPDEKKKPRCAIQTRGGCTTSVRISVNGCPCPCDCHACCWVCSCIPAMYCACAEIENEEFHNSENNK